jgi:hypothetical protein
VLELAVAAADAPIVTFNRREFRNGELRFTGIIVQTPGAPFSGTESHVPARDHRTLCSGKPTDEAGCARTVAIARHRRSVSRDASVLAWLDSLKKRFVPGGSDSSIALSDSHGRGHGSSESAIWWVIRIHRAEPARELRYSSAPTSSPYACLNAR